MQGPVWANSAVQMRELKEVGGVLCREGTRDADIRAEIERCYGWMDVEGKVVLDIGANIGCFTLWALDKGASDVIAIEPDPCNFEMLKLNVENTGERHRKAPRLVKAAVVEDGFIEKRVLLYRSNSGKNPGNYSLDVRGGRVPIEVGVVKFNAIVEGLRPACIKIDCEGAEYRWLSGDLPECVNEVAVELHFGKKKWREEVAPRLVDSFLGWETVKEPTLGGSLWHTVAGWRRRALLIS